MWRHILTRFLLSQSEEVRGGLTWCCGIAGPRGAVSNQAIHHWLRRAFLNAGELTWYLCVSGKCFSPFSYLLAPYWTPFSLFEVIGLNSKITNFPQITYRQTVAKEIQMDEIAAILL